VDDFEALSRSRTEFANRLQYVDGSNWDAATPCEGWKVSDLVEHLVVGARMTVMLLHGASRDEALAIDRGELTAGNAVDQWNDAADAQDAAFHEPGALDRVVHHPAGDMPAGQMLGFRIGDATMHAWDLSRALAVDEHLDPELVEHVWARISPMAPFIGQIGVFGQGPSGDVADDAPLQTRLLDLTGRRP
jgi:uncharacterized protein (TIGR03086 family)